MIHEYLSRWAHPKGGPVREVVGPPEPMHRRVHRLADNEITASKCYFIGGDVGFIKIGHSSNPEQRLAQIQKSSPIPVRLLAVVEGGERREAGYHIQFDEHRRHGEWFERHPEILSEIERLGS